MSQNAATVELGQLAADLAAAGGNIHAIAAGLVAEGAHAVEAQAKVYAPRRTGRMAGSIVATFADDLHATIGPGTLYAPYVEYGTRPHVIRPRKPGGVLVFTVNGRKVVARSVHHPGTSPHPFMRPAAVDAADQLAAKVGEAGANLITEQA